MNNLLAEPARVAILGPGGMGKTSLAVAALHSPKVVDKYPARHFIPCDSAQTNDALVATIASNLGLEVSQGSARHIIHHLTKGSSCLLILDNFETPWEPVDGRATVEEFLALLADIPHVGLLVRRPVLFDTLSICLNLMLVRSQCAAPRGPAKFNGPIHSCAL
jgi:ABC-type uncharacterized transport system YnjBCD ATPase subunit